jgi:glycosyltransferase involved in cell wall biosynthesis/uncharacterized protein YhbP (UPF0306 family)
VNRFWDILIHPIFQIVNAKNIVEIGAQKGINTKKVLKYCSENEGVLHTIDPFPMFDDKNWEIEFDGHFKVYKELSLSALPQIDDYDVILIDGDHNWYTVYNELKIVENKFKGKGKFPVIIAHDIGWPYGRRDLYYNPENIPPYFQQPYKKMGILPNKLQLVENKGLNAHLYNAIYENNPKNGVLTAIEDFLEESNRSLSFEKIHGFHGLGVIFENTEENAKIKDFLSTNSFKEELLTILEGDRLEGLIKINNLNNELELNKQLESNKTTSDIEVNEQLNKFSEINAKLDLLTEEKIVLMSNISSLEDTNRKLSEQILQCQSFQSNLQDQMEMSLRQTQDLQVRLRKEAIKKQKVYNSVKFKIGDILVSALKSPKALILLPYRLAKLASAAIKRKRLGKDKNNKKGEMVYKDSNKVMNFTNVDHKNNNFYKIISGLRMSRGLNFEQLFKNSETELQENIVEMKELLMVKNPLVSIIMPTFNRAEIMGEAIQSILDQTYNNWELIICDDGSTDNTQKVVQQFKDNRIKYYKLEKGGAAAARNYGLSVSNGDFIAYLDTDNIWHPQYLLASIGTLAKKQGYYSLYSRYLDVVIEDGVYNIKTARSLPFDYEELTNKNYIDLNSFVHRRELYDNLGGFSEELVRQQDWDLILKYTFLREPLYLDQFLVIYQRNKDWQQITQMQRNNGTTVEVIQKNVKSYYKEGLPSIKSKEKLPKITIVSWDVCRNHFSKAYNIAESLSSSYSVQLLGFRFFEEEIFPPYKNEVPNFELTIIEGKNFPDFYEMVSKALTQINGDIIYAVKPRMSSLGIALLANYHFGKPVILEHNDLESVVSNPGREKLQKNFDLSKVNFEDKELEIPYSSLWSNIMEEFAHKVPLSTTHNRNLDNYFGGRSFYIRNLKDETYYNPSIYNRDKLREELGYSKEDRVILFGGLLRKHKGIFELVNLLDRLNDDRYKLLFVGSRETPDQKKLIEKYGDKIKVLPPQGRNDMAKINYAADLVILWLDPKIPASHYQMPYKFTDAIAMKVPVIASDVSDLEVLAQDNCLRITKYGDFENLIKEIRFIFENNDSTREMVERARNLYIRQFSYKAVKSNLDIIFDVAMKQNNTLDVSKDFAEFFSGFYKQNNQQ